MRFLKYFSFANITFKEGLTYRFNTFAWSVLRVLMLVVFYFLWKAVFSFTGAPTLQGFTFEQMFFYYVIMSVFWTGSEGDYLLADLVKSGKAITFFTKPYDFLKSIIFTDMGNFLTTVGLYSPLLLLTAMLFFGFRFVSLESFGIGMVSFLLAEVVVMLFFLCAAMSVFWLTEYGGTASLLNAVSNILGGGVIPLTFFPGYVQKLFELTPFPSMGYYHTMILIGKATFSQSIGFILIQAAWIVVLYIALEVLKHFAIKKFTGVGA